MEPIVSFDRASDRLIFIHIPKCGGSSVHSYFKHIFGVDRYMHIAPGSAGRNTTVPYAILGSGGHQLIGRSPAENTSRKLVYLSFVRHPFDRFVSLWKHVRSGKPTHIGDFPGARRMSPGDLARLLVERDPLSIANCQCRFLSTAWVEDFDEASRTIAEKQITVLPVTTINDFAQWFSHHYRKVPVLLRRVNTSEALGMSASERSDAERVVMDCNHEDLRLFKAYASVDLSSFGLDTPVTATS